MLWLWVPTMGIEYGLISPFRGAAAGDATAYSIATTLADDIDSYLKSTYSGVPNTRYVEGNLAYEEYNPQYSNDCMYNQQPYQTYGNSSYARLKAIQEAVGRGFFFSLTGLVVSSTSS
jgi:hypothetical protein